MSPEWATGMASLRRKRQVQDFLDVIARIGELRRQSARRVYAFMLFPSAEGIQLTDLEELFVRHAAEELPHAACVLDQGVVLHALYGRNAAGGVIPVQLSTDPVPRDDGACGLRER
jgi:hypothetical protein